MNIEKVRATIREYAAEARRAIQEARAAVESGDAGEAHRMLGAYNMSRQDIRNFLSFLEKTNPSEIDVSNQDLEASAQRVMADADALLCMQECGVDPVIQRTVMNADEDADFQKVRQYWSQNATFDSLGDPAHRDVYARMVVVHHVGSTGQKLKDKLGIEEHLEKLQAATRLFFERHLQTDDPEQTAALINANLDYAPGHTDLCDRVTHGAEVQARTGQRLPGGQREIWESDLDEFVAKLQRHEYTRQQGERVLAAMRKQLDAVDQRVKNSHSEVIRLQNILTRYATGPAHMFALEQQWAAYRLMRHVDGKIHDPLIGASQPTTRDALAVAEAYCWAPTTVEAVASAAETLVPESALSPLALGDLSFPAKSGWWWFQEPIPITTTSKPGDQQPVVALLWRREVHPKLGPRMWFSTLVGDVIQLDGRLQQVPVPTTAWIWYDGLALKDLPEDLTKGYAGAYGDRRPIGVELASEKETVDASVWFSRFFLAAVTWLRQRVVTSAPGQGIRQVARQLQRTHKLREAPKIQIIELRRREIVRRDPSEHDPNAPKREYQCRWTVTGHMRNQWYAKEGVHAPKWIDAYVKGPGDKPLKERAKVYAVRR